MVLPALNRAKAKARRTTCVSRMANIGLSFRIFATDNRALYPFHISTNGLDTNASGISNAGTREFALEASQVWRHFAALSNELVTPRILYCPSDRERKGAQNFAGFTNNGFLSYTLGLFALEEQPQSVLASDRNLLRDGVVMSTEVWSFGPNVIAAFDRRIHKFAGDALLGDGSVQQVTSIRLQEQFREAAKASGTNQLLVVP